jgi:hypothetical protein
VCGMATLGSSRGPGVVVLGFLDAIGSAKCRGTDPRGVGCMPGAGGVGTLLGELVYRNLSQHGSRGPGVVFLGFLDAIGSAQCHGTDPRGVGCIQGCKIEYWHLTFPR